MADRIKGITIEIDGDTTKLSKALKDVNNDLRQNQNTLKDVDKLLKLDPGNTALLQQKFKALGDSIEQTKTKLQTLKTAEQQMMQNGQVGTAEWDNLQREIVETEQKLKSLNGEMDKFGSVTAQKVAAAGEKVKSVGQSIEGAGRAVMPVSAAVIGIGAAAVKTTSDFDSAMSQVSAVSGATGKDLEDLRAKAREMGAKTKFSATEAAEGFNYMAMAGWKTGDMLSGIEGVMNLAAASGEDLGTTSDIVTDALTAFGMSAKDSGHFADILAAASSNANTNVSMMGETFKYAAPVAGAMGYSAEDAAVAIGLMANSGIKASQAGTALRTGLTNLAKPTDTMQAAMDKYGITLSDSSGKMYSMRELMVQLREKMGGLETQEQTAAAAAIFGKNAMSGWLAVINASDEDFNKLTGAIDNCDGSAEKMANTMNDNLEGQLTILKSALQELAISIGEVLVPIIRDVVSFIQKIVDWLNKLSPAQKELVVRIGLIVAAAGPLLIVIGKIVTAVGSIMTLAPKFVTMFNTIKTAAGVLGGGLKALWAVMMANPITLVIAAIAAIVAAFIYFWNTSESFRQFWINLWEGIKTAVANFVDAIKVLWGNIVTACSQAWETIKNVVSVAIQFLAELFTTALEILMIPWRFIWENFGTYLVQAWENIKTLLGKALEAIKTLLTTAWNAIKTALEPIIEAIKTVITTAWNAIKTAISTVLGAIKSVVTSVWNAIKSVVTSILNAIKTTATNVWNAIKTTVSNVIGNIKSTVSSGLNAVKSTFTSILNGIKSTVSNVWNGIVGLVRGAVQKLKNLVNFHWELPHIKLPHFSISGSFSLNPPSIPHISVSWYKKAMENGMILNDPTIFGAAGGKLLGGGEAGPEAVVGVDSLRSMIGEAVEAAAGAGGDIIIPVSIGQRRIDTIVVDALQRNNYRSGGR